VEPKRTVRFSRSPGTSSGDRGWVDAQDVGERTDGPGRLRFVEDDSREFLACGVPAEGFARFQCEGRGLNHLRRPPAQDRRVGGTSHLAFEPVDFLALQ
jgi:hypothetical protein